MDNLTVVGFVPYVHVYTRICTYVHMYTHACVHACTCVRIRVREASAKQMQITQNYDTFGFCDQNPLKVPILQIS